MIEKIIAPLSNVNDDTVVVYEYFAEDKSAVKKGQEVLSIETSKATNALTTPVEGFIKYIIPIGDEVPNGTVLAIVADTVEALDGYVGGENTVVEDKQSDDLLLQGRFNNHSETEQMNLKFGIFNETVTLCEIYVKEGAVVGKGDDLCIVRMSKGTEKVTAPGDGHIYWFKRQFDTVKSGEYIGIISSDGACHLVENETRTAVVDIDKHYETLRMSKAASELLREHNITAETLGLTGLVKYDDVLVALGKKQKKIPDGGGCQAVIGYWAISLTFQNCRLAKQ